MLAMPHIELKIVYLNILVVIDLVMRSEDHPS